MMNALAAIGRPGQPVECATAFVYLASADSSYFTAQVSHIRLLNSLSHSVDKRPSASTSMADRRTEL